MQEPWKTDKWFISPWNYLPEVTKNYGFPANIKIHDVTLRDGEQQTAVVFRREEKVAIAKKLDSLGVHRIEAGMPAVSPQDKAAICRHRGARPEGRNLRFLPLHPHGSQSRQGLRLHRGSSSRFQPAIT